MPLQTHNNPRSAMRWAYHQTGTLLGSRPPNWPGSSMGPQVYHPSTCAPCFTCPLPPKQVPGPHDQTVDTPTSPTYKRMLKFCIQPFALQALFKPQAVDLAIALGSSKHLSHQPYHNMYTCRVSTSPPALAAGAPCHRSPTLPKLSHTHLVTRLPLTCLRTHGVGGRARSHTHARRSALRAHTPTRGPSSLRAMMSSCTDSSWHAFIVLTCSSCKRRKRRIRDDLSIILDT